MLSLFDTGPFTHCPSPFNLAGHVLARLYVEQSGALPPLLDRAVDMCLAWLSAD